MIGRAGFFALMVVSPIGAVAQDKAFSLTAPDAMVESGFLKYVLPRFSLKTGVKIEIVAEGGDAAFGADGVPVFREGDIVWHLSGGDADIDRFRDWLVSDVGKRAVEGFDGGAYSSDFAVDEVVAEISFEGDAAVGEKVSLLHCGRCHVVNDSNRMNAIGSSPSFALLRTFTDWDQRFAAFYALKPHAAFTQIEDVTEPFDISRPSPIVPIEITLEDLEAIMAYVAVIAPADLGAPIQSQ